VLPEKGIRKRLTQINYGYTNFMKNSQECPLIEIASLAEEGAELPRYASEGASGADVKAFIKNDIVIPPGSSCLIPTGLRLAIPAGFEIQVRPRSGLALKSQVTVLNTPGTIDADYRGEIGIILINHGKEHFVVAPGMRIAQLVLAPVVQALYIPAQELAETARGCGGFGHTGIR
jgi:dUTP pyrophosphatase